MEKNNNSITPLEATSTLLQRGKMEGNCILEVCTGSLTSVLHAAEGGAQRIELCSGLDEGGVTPSIGLIHAAMQVEGPKKHILVRPRGGDFLYSEYEQDVIVEDILAARRAGADGVVVGALTADGDVDVEACSRFVDAAQGEYVDFAEGDLDEAYFLPPMSVTFHRAFDLCRDPKSALETIIELGFDRILTSGQAATAEAGIPLLKELVELSSGRITIMPGCGVNASNAAKILNETGATEIHASARSSWPSQMRFRHPGVSMGTPGSDEYATKETDVETVRTIVESIA